MPHSDQSLWYAWLIPLFPLVGFLINGFLGPLTGKPLPKLLAGIIGTAAVFASFGVACLLFQHVMAADEAHKQATVYLMQWLNVPADANYHLHGNGAHDGDRKSTRLNSSHVLRSRMPSSA